jgi:NTE family protein
MCPEVTQENNRKRIKVALQGGGSHGAFTWGVLDRLLDDPRLEIEAVVGTSAGAMNAAVLVDGLAHGGPAAARCKLREFWTGVSLLAATSPMRQSPLDQMLGPGNMDFSPSWHVADVLNKMFSPYELNPINVNPLRQLLESVIDFDRLRAGTAPALFMSATNVLTGRLRVFARHEVSIDTVMASACLPLLFQAVEIEGQHYWDGGYCGNPPIFPLIYMGGGSDVLIIQLNPINIPTVPQDVGSIIDRVNTLSFNSSLMREMRMIKFVTDLIDNGELSPNHFLRINIHTIDAEIELAAFNTSSKANADKKFLRHLYALGVAKATEFLEVHFDAIGQRSSTDIVEKFF